MDANETEPQVAAITHGDLLYLTVTAEYGWAAAEAAINKRAKEDYGDFTVIERTCFRPYGYFLQVRKKL